MISVGELIKISGRSRPTVYRDIKKGLVTKTENGILEDGKLTEYLSREKYQQDAKIAEREKAKKPEPKYTPPPLNQKTSLSMDWVKKIKHVTEYDFERDHDYEAVEKRLVNGTNAMLELFQGLEPEVIIADDDIQKNYREWMKLAHSIVKTKRDIDTKKEAANKSSDNPAIFREILKVSQGG